MSSYGTPTARGDTRHGRGLATPSPSRIPRLSVAIERWKLSQSAAALREVIRINPNHYNARYNLGELFRLEAKYDESVKQFREYLRLAPDLPQNRRNIERAKGFVEKFSDQEP